MTDRPERDADDEHRPAGVPGPGDSYRTSPAPQPAPYSIDEPVDEPADEPAADQGAAADSQAPADRWSLDAEPTATVPPAQPSTAPLRPEWSRDWSSRPDDETARRPQLQWTAPRTAEPTGYPPAEPPVTVPPPGSSAAPGDAYSWADVRSTSWPPSSPAAPPPGPRARPRRDRRRVSRGVVVLLMLVALLAGVVLGALGGREFFPTEVASLPAPSLPSARASVDRAPESVAGIAAAALESTVYIQVFGGSTAASGSGMVLREDGYIVTNNHVIAPATVDDGKVTVTFADGTEKDAEIVGRTEDYDIAVLRVDRDGLTPLVLAEGGAVVVGDPAVAVGAPLGLEGTVTTGIISALNRPVQAGGTGEGTSSFINAIQTDAAINPGNSGGPLLNLAGEVVGINTAIAQAAGQETGSIGLGFAIPSDQVRRTAEQIIEDGHATYPVIGVALDTRYQGEGVQVLESDSEGTEAVTSGGPGDLAGIEPGDVVTRVDGVPVTSPPELIVAVRSRAPGETLVLTVRRDGDEQQFDVVLGEEASD